MRPGAVALRKPDKEHDDVEAPNAKHQISNKSQSLKFERKSFWSFEIGIWSLFEIWNL
jgi:hypothetical protein